MGERTQNIINLLKLILTYCIHAFKCILQKMLFCFLVPQVWCYSQSSYTVMCSATLSCSFRTSSSEALISSLYPLIASNGVKILALLFKSICGCLSQNSSNYSCFGLPAFTSSAYLNPSGMGIYPIPFDIYSPPFLVSHRITKNPSILLDGL